MKRVKPQFSLLMLLIAVAVCAVACTYVRWFGVLGFVTIAFIFEMWGLSALLTRLGVDEETSLGVTWMVFLLTFYPILLIASLLTALS